MKRVKVAENGQEQSVAFINFEFKDNIDQILPVAGDEDKKPISMGLYLCVCHNQNIENNSDISHHSECFLHETARKKNIKHCSKLYGILDDPSNANANTSTLTWGEFLEEHYKTKFDSSFDYTIKFNTGRKVRFEDKVTSFFKKRKGRRHKRSFSITSITKIPKQTSIDTASTVTETCDKNLDKSGSITSQSQPIYEEPRVEGFSFGAHLFPNSKMLSLFEFARKFANLPEDKI